MKLKSGVKNNKGEIMLESLIVYSVTIMLLFFVLAIFSVLFQRWNIQTIANESAARFAQTYRFTDKEISSGYITKEQLLEVEDYRYLIGKDDLENAVRRQIEEYASDRLSKTTFTQNVSEPEIEVAVEKDNISRRHITVTIKGEYSVPLGDILSYFGFDSTIKYETKAYADCVDIIDYVNTANFIDNQLETNILDAEIIDAINSVFSLFDNIFN